MARLVPVAGVPIRFGWTGADRDAGAGAGRGGAGLGGTGRRGACRPAQSAG